MSSLQEAVLRAWYIRTGTILRAASSVRSQHEVEECRKNVTRSNAVGKLRYCIAR